MAITSALDPGAFAPGADPMRPVPFRIRRRSQETHDVFTLTLAPPPGAGPFSFAPGQFNMLYALGRGEVPISMSGPPGEVKEIVHTIRAVGPVTQALGRMKAGETVGLRGPYGTAWPVAAAEGADVVMVAGGIGLAPIRPAIYHVFEHRERYGRVVLLFGARTPSDIPFVREIESWRGRFDVDVEVTVDRAGQDWRGLVGVVTTVIPRVHFDPHNTAAFLCGPELMITFSARELIRRGVVPQRIQVSLERNMKCAIGLCGHCQMGPKFVCKDGPVFRYDQVSSLLGIREV
jgi:NAD(P)H-flavin reductase